MPDRLDRILDAITDLRDKQATAHQAFVERLARIEERVLDLPGLRQSVEANENRIARLEKQAEATKTKLAILGVGAGAGGVGLLSWVKHWLGIGH